MIVGRQIQERRTRRRRRRRRRNASVTPGVVSPRRGRRNPGQTRSTDVSEQIGAPILSKDLISFNDLLASVFNGRVRLIELRLIELQLIELRLIEMFRSMSIFITTDRK